MWPFQRSQNNLDLWNFIVTVVEFKCIIASKSQKQSKTIFVIFSIQKPMGNQIRPCHKKGQGQPRVSVYINFEELTTQMLGTNFRGNQSDGSGEEDFFFL